MPLRLDLQFYCKVITIFTVGVVNAADIMRSLSLLSVGIVKLYDM